MTNGEVFTQIQYINKTGQRVPRTRAYDSVAQEDCGVLDGTEDLESSEGFDRVTRTTAVSRRHIPTIQLVQKSSKVFTEFKLVSAKEAKDFTQFERVDPDKEASGSVASQDQWKREASSTT